MFFTSGPHWGPVRGQSGPVPDLRPSPDCDYIVCVLKRSHLLSHFEVDFWEERKGKFMMCHLTFYTF
ncbi:hypothetical protein M758_4G102500 [Ceratodon purpureus]|uniref:Uncharacterized protein n=1 Tax=Ceratodon purpureus TaxID=3225 RepID=A0A8T0I967_CERPU|nr:hypothetical protein KC19_4G104200 [Ceratodon purpureus]KAG0618926.1 hypothetical protein M758_4G102500 [Ceratodon purpureus]